jgi:hypothetical protein
MDLSSRSGLSIWMRQTQLNMCESTFLVGINKFGVLISRVMSLRFDPGRLYKFMILKSFTLHLESDRIPFTFSTNG